jgi:hypothetical protein
LRQLLEYGGAVELDADGARRVHASVSGQVLMPGSFHPIHEGHWKLAQTGQTLLGRDVAFELSLANVDKPDLAWDEVGRRAEQFQGKATLWITRAPTFVQKAELFPEAVFVIGADTAIRILHSRYYAPGEDSVAQAMRFLRERGCRFLVGCRVDGEERFLRRQDLPIPAEFDDLFCEIPPESFRVDLSSSEIRRKSKTV